MYVVSREILNQHVQHTFRLKQWLTHGGGIMFHLEGHTTWINLLDISAFGHLYKTVLKQLQDKLLLEGVGYGLTL